MGLALAGERSVAGQGVGAGSVRQGSAVLRVRSGWRFIILDSIHPAGAHAFTGALDETQRDWLERELKEAAGRPIIVVSHIPLLTTTVFTYDTHRVAGGVTHVPGGWMHLDAAPLHYLLREYPNVKLCLSGHMHLLDRCEVDGVTYICGGAVSGDWWEGNLQMVEEGYGLVDLYSDGSFDYGYVPYGWRVPPQARAAADA